MKSGNQQQKVASISWVGFLMIHDLICICLHS